ncbi:transglutaminase family protein [Georgenia sp. MJ206]|uniref:transglutaminase-like domain-containing protein n=1 Tax=Georgenia wangjunii TaxID=3117730 RepID=UPI002F26D18F
MRTNVSATISMTTSAGAAQLAFMVAVARVPGLAVQEALTVTLDGEPQRVVELAAAHHGRVHVVDLPPATRYDQTLTLTYDAGVEGGPADDVETPRTELLTYLRPSRYAESDRLLATARSEFRGLTGRELLAAVAGWVGQHLTYVTGSSRGTDGAVETLLDRRGVCRDYAHLVIALLRSLDVPARLAAVYAPGLAPMDFHAVAEAWVDGAWHVVDATLLAPRSSLVRIATGRDAADTAFLSSYGAPIRMGRLLVTAVVDGDLPTDDLAELVRLP